MGGRFGVDKWRKSAELGGVNRMAGVFVHKSL